MKKSSVFIIAGPTGCGETTITNEIVKKFPQFKRLVTATTRPPRLNEKNGIDYYFFSEQKFKKEIEDGNILEYTYIENRGVYYGTYRLELEDKLNNNFGIIVNPDIVGMKFFKEKYGAVTIFVKAESMESLKRRLTRREPNISQTELQKRLKNAENEIKDEEKFYDYIIINEEGKLDETIQKVAEIIKKYM